MNGFEIFFVFGIVGIFAEIIFTSIIDGIKNKDVTLRGTSYLWMFPIYGCAGLLIDFLRTIFSGHSFLFRGAIYGAYIMVGEFVCGLFLKFLLGKCPWNYTSRFSWLNVVRLDYFPVWFVFGLLLERLLLFLH